METSHLKDWDSLGSRCFHNVAVFTRLLRPDVYPSLSWPCRRGFRVRRWGNLLPKETDAPDQLEWKWSILE